MRRALAFFALAAVVSGCTPKQAPTAVPASVQIAERATKLDVPPGFEPQYVEFVDASSGYALMVKSEQKRVEAIPFRTTDGGATWSKLTHPRPVAENQQLYVSSATTVVLLAEPHAWYVSKDSGSTWQERPYHRDGVAPAEYPMGTDAGRFYLNYDTPVIRDREDPAFKFDLPTGYENASLTNGVNELRIWLAALKDGQPITVQSHRGTMGFTPVEVPRQPGRAIYHARVVISYDAKDVWLFADQEAAGPSSAGRSARLALKGSGLPLVWKLVGDRWKPLPLTEIEENQQRPYSVAPAGAGALMVASPGQTGYLSDGRFVRVPGTPNLHWVGVLRDGTLAGNDNHPGVVYVGQGEGANRTWVKVSLLPH